MKKVMDLSIDKMKNVLGGQKCCTCSCTCTCDNGATQKESHLDTRQSKYYDQHKDC